VAEYYTSQEANDPDYESSDTEEAQPASNVLPGGGRRLGDAPTDPQPIPVASSSEPKSKPVARKKFATLGDIGNNGEDDDDDEDETKKKRNLFAGGEKSGLAVQDPDRNPDDIKKKIIQKAMKKGPPAAEEKPRRSNFTGPAQTLGGDDAPSRQIVPSEPTGPTRNERVHRTLHFWEDGFSVDDGDLYRSDDPRNAAILSGIQRGTAPLSIMNVLPGQEVDVEIKQHQEKFVQPKKKFQPFGGQGNRLGSPTPGDTSVSMPGSFDTATTEPVAPSAVSSDPKPQIDESQPTVTLRISLGSGTRLTARFNTTSTMREVYDFVNRAEPSQRQFVLQTTFPNKEMTDMSLVLGEIPEFKRGGAVVQKL
jgi:UBX domain-containing protein 1